MFESRASIARAQTKSDLTEYPSEKTDTFAFDIEVFQRDASLLLGLILRQNCFGQQEKTAE
jgi:serine/threonine protein kinase HipA of HipAB toxin-antitoxin module